MENKELYKLSKPILQIIFEKDVMDLLKHVKVNCPTCSENYDLFTTIGVLPELTDCQTGRCGKCNADFYYLKGKCWFETFTQEDLAEIIKENQANFGKGEVIEEVK